MIKKSDLRVIEEGKITFPSSNYIFGEDRSEAEMLANIMCDKAGEYNVLGLSCPQVGVDYAMFVMLAGNVKIKVFNPTIVKYSDDCSVVPMNSVYHRLMLLTCSRSNHIDVEYTNEKGEKVETSFSGLTAAIFQQMYEYTLGVTMRDRVSKFKWNRAITAEKKKINQIMKRITLPK